MIEDKKDFSYYTYHVGRDDYKKASKKLEWNVFVEDINAKKIIPYNIFEHGSFYSAIYNLNKNLLKEVNNFRKDLSYEIEFKEKLHSNSNFPYMDESELPRLKKKLKDFDKLDDEHKKETVFKEKVRRNLSYYFWSKSEWEVILSSWPPYVDSDEIDRLIKEREEHLATWGKFYQTDCNVNVSEKIDVYTQVMMNWDCFIDYLWNNRNLIKKR